jgi:hypothetical protein
MHFNIFASGHCIFHDIDEDSFIVSEILFWYACISFVVINRVIENDYIVRIVAKILKDLARLSWHS